MSTLPFHHLIVTGSVDTETVSSLPAPSPSTKLLNAVSALKNTVERYVCGVWVNERISLPVSLSETLTCTLIDLASDFSALSISRFSSSVISGFVIGFKESQKPPLAPRLACLSGSKLISVSMYGSLIQGSVTVSSPALASTPLFL